MMALEIRALSVDALSSTTDEDTLILLIFTHEPFSQVNFASHHTLHRQNGFFSPKQNVPESSSYHSTKLQHNYALE